MISLTATQLQSEVNSLSLSAISEFDPLEISGVPPHPGAVVALVWPQNEPVPDIGRKREILFDGVSVVVEIMETMGLEEGYVGVLGCVSMLRH